MSNSTQARRRRRAHFFFGKVELRRLVLSRWKYVELKRDGEWAPKSVFAMRYMTDVEVVVGKLGSAGLRGWYLCESYY